MRMSELKKDEHNLKRNLLFNTAGSMFYFICQWLITGLLVERLAGVYNAGLLATAMTVTNVFLTLASYGMRTYQVSDAKERFSNSVYIASRVVTIAAAVLLCAGYTMVIGYGAEQAICIYIYLFYKLLESLTDVFHGCAQKRDRMDVIGISYAVRGLLSVAAFSLGLYLTQSLILALVLMTALCYGFSFWYDILRTRPFYLPLERPQASRVGALLWECAPLAVYVFLNTAAASVPKLMLERMMGTNEIGIYNLVNSPVLILQVGVTYLFSPFITMFTEKLNNGDRRGFKKLAVLITLGVFGVGVLGIAGVLLLGKWGLALLYGQDMVAYSPLLVPMVVCTVFTSLSLFYCMLLTVLREMRGLIGANLIGILVSLLISRPLIARYEMFGTSYATILALIVQCVALAVFGLLTLNKAKK